MANQTRSSEEDISIAVHPDPLDLLHKQYMDSYLNSDIQFKKSLELKRQLSTNKLPLMKFEETKSISSKIIPTTGVTGFPTCIATSKHMIIIGSSFGLLTVFSHDGTELKVLKQKSVGSAICIDISDDEQWAAAGYHGGQLCLWDLRSGSCTRSSGNIFSASVVSCKFWKHNKNNVIAADLMGKVALMEYGKSFLTTTINSNTILTGEAGIIISIEPLFSDPNWPHSTDSSVVVAMACVDRILVYSLEPETTILLGIERPDEVPENFLPCISLKLAAAPGEEQALDPILAIAWGMKIYLHKIKFASPEGIQLVGTYTMDTEIKDIKLLGHDVLLVLSNNREVMILSTKGFSRSQSDLPKDSILEELLVNKDIAVQAYIKDSTGKEKYTYNNMITSNEASVFILGNKQLHKGRLLSWKECILELSKNGDWIQALSLGIDFYHGKGCKLYAIPHNKQELKSTFEGVVEEYVKAANISWDFKIANTIDFCVGIDSTDFLFNFFFNYFIDEGNGPENLKLFIEIIEPYILYGEINTIPKVILSKILSHYLAAHKPGVIEKILLHLDSNCIDPAVVLPICEEYSLVTAYIYMSIANQSFTKPIDFMLDLLKKQQDETSKRIYCYQILWYMKLLLKGEKFPKGFIPSDLWNKVICIVLGRLVEGDLLQNLVMLDANTTLKVVWIAFQDLVPSQVLESLKNLSINELIGKLECVCVGSAFHHFALFVARLSFLRGDEVPKSLAIKSLLYLMTPNTNRKAIQSTNSTSFDIFIANSENCNDFMTELDYSIEQKSELLIKLIKNYSSYTILELDELYKVAVNSPYTEVLVHLLEVRQDYKQCFLAFLQCSNVDVCKKVFDWLSVTFPKLAGPELESLKIEVVNNLNILVDIDSDKTAKIVRDWYHGEHHNIIHKLDNAPVLQMKYLGELLKSQEKDTIEEKLILLYVKLLCESAPNQVLSFLKSREDFSLDECLAVCSNYNNIEASAYLYERLGAIKNALDLHLGMVDKKRKEIQKGIKNYEKVIYSEILEEISNSVKLCVRNVARLDENENEEHWFCLLGKILETYIELAPNFINNNDLESCIQSAIKLCLENMIDHVDFQKIISFIVEKYGNIPFKYFKENFIGILSRFSYQKTILKKAIDLLCSDIKYMTQQLVLLKSKGISSKRFYCSGCTFPIVSEDIMKNRGEKFLLFVCGHAYHCRCIKKRVCEVCLKDELKRGNFLEAISEKKA
ncbi:hypothetical protein SteCoe_23007 [Stentor coeruleus]|uniref:Vacuolar protein sorting-associated protein 8 central domain-containing protein n=1 Tax=Stentor coeruleus TaxID=5963 RepID=A0A1R2BL00_9CILI|nr:hypothetical protein SteCoe_23007 [Stentor coeruleus]